MNNALTSSKELFLKILYSWQESILFLIQRKSLEQFILVSTKSLIALIRSLGLLFLGIVFYLFFSMTTLEQSMQANKHLYNTFHLQQFSLFNWAVIILCITLSGLRASTEIKDRAYYFNCFSRLIPFFLTSYLWSLIFFQNQGLNLYSLLYFTVASPVFCFVILFLLDSKNTIGAYFYAFKKALIFCVLNAPAICILYGIISIGILCMNFLASYTTHVGITIMLYVATLVCLFFPYWALLTSLYIKRMHDHLEYYL